MKQRVTRLLPWLILAAAAAALSVLAGCPLRRLFGVSCPLCGMSRALLCAVRADFRGAFRYHLLWPLLLSGLCAMALLARSRPRGAKLLGVSLALLFLSVYLVRMLLHDPVLSPDLSSGLLSGLFDSIFFREVFLW